MSEWQPIATVPKGVRVLLGKIGAKLVVLAKIDAGDPKRAWASDGWPYPCDATHWMPLPDPPVAEEPSEAHS